MRKPDKVEIVAVAVPVLAEAIAVLFTIAAACILVAVFSGRLPV